MCFYELMRNDVWLQGICSEERRKILLGIADALEANENLIIVENKADVTAAENAGYDKALVSRLALTPKKVSEYESDPVTVAHNVFH